MIRLHPCLEGEEEEEEDDHRGGNGLHLGGGAGIKCDVGSGGFLRRDNIDWLSD